MGAICLAMPGMRARLCIDIILMGRACIRPSVSQNFSVGSMQCRPLGCLCGVFMISYLVPAEVAFPVADPKILVLACWSCWFLNDSGIDQGCSLLSLGLLGQLSNLWLTLPQYIQITGLVLLD